MSTDNLLDATESGLAGADWLLEQNPGERKNGMETGERCGIIRAAFPAPCYDISREGKVKMLKEDPQSTCR